MMMIRVELLERIFSIKNFSIMLFHVLWSISGKKIALGPQSAWPLQFAAPFSCPQQVLFEDKSSKAPTPPAMLGSLRSPGPHGEFQAVPAGREVLGTCLLIQFIYMLVISRATPTPVCHQNENSDEKMK